MNDFTNRITIDDAADAAGAAAAYGASDAPKFRTRTDLSFTHFSENPRVISNWNPERGEWLANQDAWTRGEAYFDEVSELAKYDEVQASSAILQALMSPTWLTGRMLEEHGFAKALASCAIVGLRALANGSAKFDRDAYVADASGRAHPEKQLIASTFAPERLPTADRVKQLYAAQRKMYQADAVLSLALNELGDGAETENLQLAIELAKDIVAAALELYGHPV